MGHRQVLHFTTPYRFSSPKRPYGVIPNRRSLSASYRSLSTEAPGCAKLSRQNRLRPENRAYILNLLRRSFLLDLCPRGVHLGHGLVLQSPGLAPLVEHFLERYLADVV
jgi:hypothetical protein